jgi:hypothetical protein
MFPLPRVGLPREQCSDPSLAIHSGRDPLARNARTREEEKRREKRARSDRRSITREHVLALARERGARGARCTRARSLNAIPDA